MSKLNGRIRKLESLIGTPRPAPLRPTQTLERIEAVLLRVFKDMPDRLRVHAERVFHLGEDKSDQEARVILNNITLARKLRGKKC